MNTNIKNRLIYCLKCPATGNIHYVGKSSSGMFRPASHLSSSHSVKINEWVQDLKNFGNKPTIEVLEYVQDEDDLDVREKYWISKCIDDGYVLLNEFLIKPVVLRLDLQERLEGEPDEEYKAIGKFIAERRKLISMTQQQFADITGIALTVIRKIEQGKKNLNFDSVLNVLAMFGCTLGVIKSKQI